MSTNKLLSNMEILDIPIVDFGSLDIPCDLNNFDPIKQLSPQDPLVQTLSAEVVKVLTDVGFCYIINHGISKELINKGNKAIGDFFALPTDVKSNYRRTAYKDSNGWLGLHEERLDPKSEPDYKETVNITPVCTSIKKWPPSEVPLFKAVAMEVIDSNIKLSYLILKLIGIGLKLEDPDYFIKMHNIRPCNNLTSLSGVLYHPVPCEIQKKPGMMWCGEHTDFSSISLVYQDSVGGLQVKHQDGHYIPATPMEGAVVVIVGELMQRWTADRLLATIHRVVVPKEDPDQPRRSLVFFIQPDDDVVIRCIDNSDKYPSVTPYQYIMERRKIIQPLSTD